MKMHLEYMSFYLLISTLLLVIGIGDAFTCPEHCVCSDIQRKRYNYNHAKCTSLDGLRQLGKTPDLYSLDLSSMNLTKINNQLDKLTNLSKLDLTDNRLSEVNSLGAKRIRILNLRLNRITSGKLMKIPSTVKHLNLSQNDITILTENFKRFVHLKSLELADNPLNCTCETLDIRNWLQERKVWTEKPIRCMAPLQFKGRSWLQIRQSEVCDPNGLETPRMLPFSDSTDDENDLMLGDDPNAGQTENISDNDDEAIDPEFLPVLSQKNRDKRTDADSDSDIDMYDDDEVSSNTSEQPSEHQLLNGEPTELYEGSGDENDITETSSIIPPIVLDDDNQTNNETVPVENENTASNETTMFDAPLKLNSNEIIDSKENASVENDSENETTVTPETIEPINKMDVEQIPSTFDSLNEGTKSESNRIAEPIQEGKSTYILLAILGVLLIALILYVAMKRGRSNLKNRRNNNDIESTGQELTTMDKNNLGKPSPNPVEFIPLIPNKQDTDKKNNLHNNEEPLLQKLTEVENENHQANDDTAKNPEETQTPTQHRNGNAKPVQNGVYPDKINDSSANDQRQFQSISLKPSRYSPVYSHDTGRVKIKLSETNRPKTPILVTRTRSNAADDKFENTISQ